jgi:hypothetical protein
VIAPIRHRQRLRPGLQACDSPGHEDLLAWLIALDLVPAGAS